MAKKKFLEDVKLNPARFYRVPSDVNRDRRLTDEERLEVLEAWERDARALSVASDEAMTGGEPSQLEQVVLARMEVQKRVPQATTEVHEASKYGGGATGTENSHGNQ
jgi:hypothetical protein